MTNTRNNTYSSGESLSELLVAALIISLAMIMLFSGVKVGSDLMRSSRDKYKEYNDELNTYESEQAEYVRDHSAPVVSSFSFSMTPHK